MSHKTVLIVEDNPDDEAMTLFALEKNQIADKVIVKRDGAEALNYLFATGEYAGKKMELPDLILLDIQLPQIDGLEVLRRIRQNTHTRLVPVVILTTSDEEQDRQQGYELCANSFVRKPVNFDKFVEIIRYIVVYWLGINESPPWELH